MHYHRSDAHPSIHVERHFNAENAAESLRNAMSGLGSDKEKIVRIVCHISNAQRQELALSFKSAYGVDLVDELTSELGGDFEELVVALMTPSSEYDARKLHDAISAGIGTKESVLIEILATRANEEISRTKCAYRRLYDTDLEDDIAGDTSGDFQRILVALSTAHRDESRGVDRLKANQDAHLLLNCGERCEGTDESAFIQMFATQNHSQLRALFDEYEKVSEGGRTIEEAIESEFSGDIRDALLAIAKTARDRIAFFAELINNAMKGLGTHDSDLIRLVVSRSEIDLATIRERFADIYGRKLVDAVSDECSGAYKHGLLAIIKGNC